MRMTVLEQVLKARDSNDVTVGKVSSVILRFLLNKYCEAPSTPGGAGFAEVAEVGGGCLVEGEEVIGLLPGFSEQEEVQ